MTISVDNLFKIPLIYHIDLSSDGRSVLYSSNPNGIPQLYLLETKPNSKPRQITSGNDATLVGFLSPTGDRILYLQDKDGNELHHLFLTSNKGENPKRITKNAYRTVGSAWHPNGREVVRSYGTKDSSGIEIFNLETGESFLLKEQKALLMGAKYSHDGKWIACTERGGGKDPKNLQVTVFNRDDPNDVINYKFKDGSKEMLPSWSPDDKKLAFISNVKGRNQVVIQEFQGEEHFFLDLEEGEEASGAQEIGWDPKGDKVYYVVSKHSRTRIYEHPFDGEKTALPFLEGTIHAFRISKDGKTIAAVHSSMASPHSLYLYETESGNLTPLTTTKHKVNLTRLSKPKSIWYESFDGLKIHAWYLPAGRGKPPHPAVVWPHGGPWAQTSDAWSPYLQALSQSGFAVLAPNFRGSTGYGEEFRNMDIGDPGGGDLEDVVYGAKWLAKLAEIDKSKIAIMGGSYGGFMTLIALTKKPEVFASGVALVPVADWVEEYYIEDAFMRSADHELFGGTLEEKEELYRDRSPITHISKIKAPVLIIAGRHDSRCPIEPTEKFVKKLKEMNHPHEFRVQENEGHGFMRIKAAIEEAKTSIEFLKRTLNVH